MIVSVVCIHIRLVTGFILYRILHHYLKILFSTSFVIFFAGMAGVIISRITNLIKSMRHDNKPSIDNYEQIEIERYMTNEEVGRLVINFMKRTNGEPLLIVFPEYDNGDENRN